MRYIGNKTKLLGFLGSVVDDIGIVTGRAADLFSGTASVAQFLKGRGFATESCDLMHYSYVFQRAYVELDSMPDFSRVLANDADLSSAVTRADFHATLRARFGGQHDLFTGDFDGRRNALHKVLVYLDSYLSPMTALIAREYSASSSSPAQGERLFFTGVNGRQIDAIRTCLEEWRNDELLSDDEFYLLLACLLEAADAVANTTGVYAAFVKSWQGNALKPLRLQDPNLITGTGLKCKAHQGDANAFVREMSYADVAYLDPPYNTRQYIAYYHVPEVIAEGWFDGEPQVRGKTGLTPNEHKKSRWSVASECTNMFRDLVANLNADYVLLSYNNEGIIPLEAILDVFAEFGRPGTFATYKVDYARYRSDRDHDSREYIADRVTESIFATRLARSKVPVGILRQ